MRCCGPSAPPAPAARLRRCGRCCAAAGPPPPPSSRGRTAKNPADWGRDYDAIRDSLQRDDRASLFSFSGALNFVSEAFGGGAGARRGGGKESLGEALLGGAYSLLYRAGGRWSEAEADAGGGAYQVDPAPLLRASARASDAERDAAATAWRDGGDDELAPLLACGCASPTHPSDIADSCALASRTLR